MSEYCIDCGEELDPDEEFEGICKNCKNARRQEEYKTDEDYVDPGVT